LDDVLTVCWDPTGQRIAMAGKGRVVRIFDAANPQQAVRLRADVEAHAPRKASVAWNPRGDQVAAGIGGDGKTIRIWSADATNEPRRLSGHGAAVEAVAWSPDGRRLASSDYGGTVIIWDPATAARVAKLVGHTGQVYAVAWSPEGKHLASAGRDGTVRIWEVPTGSAIQVLSGHRLGPGGAYRGATSVAWHPEGALLASAGADSAIRIWNPFTGEPQGVMQAGGPAVIDLAWSPHGARIATASSDSHVRIWQAADGHLLHTCRGHSDWVSSVDWHPDGSRLASSSAAGHIAVWDAATGRQALHLRSGQTAVRQVAWSGDGLRLAIAREDGVVEIRDATIGYRLERSTTLLPRLDARIAADAYSAGDLQLRAAIHARAGNWGPAVDDFQRLARFASADAPRWLEAGWWVIGPYPADLQRAQPPESAVDPFLPVASEPPHQRPADVRHWQPANADPGGLIDLGTYCGDAAGVSAYALLPIYAAQQRNVAVLLGSDDGVRLWCNGRLVHENDVTRTAAAGQDVVVVTLHAGWNRLLAKVVNQQKGHALIVRLSDDPADLTRASATAARVAVNRR
jgi:WD40 repeat protein